MLHEFVRQSAAGSARLREYVDSEDGGAGRGRAAPWGHSLSAHTRVGARQQNAHPPRWHQHRQMR